MALLSDQGDQIHGGNVLEWARSRNIPVEKVLDFSANIGPYGMPPVAASLPKDEWAQVAAYPDAFRLRERLAEKHRVDSHAIVLGNGSAALIFAAVRALRPGRALILEPAFAEYRRALAASGAAITECFLSPEADFLPDADLIVPLASEASSDVVFLNNPHNPSGACRPSEWTLALADRLADQKRALVLDEAFADFAGGVVSAASVARRQDLISIRSLTKFYAMPGLRVGYAVCHPSLAARMGAQIEPWPVSGPALWAAEAAVSDREFESRVRALNEAARQRFAERLGREGLKVFPSAANFLLVDLGSASAAAFTNWMADRNVLVRNCRSFRGMGDRFIRLAVRSGRDNDRLADLVSVWRAHPGAGSGHVGDAG